MRRSLSASFSFASAFFLVAGLSVSCGDDDDEGPATGGTGGGGAGVGPVACGSKICQPIVVGFEVPPVPACCADKATSTCGLDTSLLSILGAQPTRPCEPVGQEGSVDPACPAAENVMLGGISVNFQGCCRAETQSCGYLVDRVSVISVGLGCVDSSPFLGGATPMACGSN